MSAKKIYGFHSVASVLKAYPQFVLRLYIQERPFNPRLQSLQNLAKNIGISVEICSRSIIDRLLGGSQVHQGVLIEVKQFPQYLESDIETILSTTHTPLILILDGVQDPHNLGACLRSANGFRVDLVIAPKNRSVGMTSTVSKIACGAAEITPFITVTNLSRSMRQLQKLGIWLIGTISEGESMIFDIDMKGPVGIVMGSESKGLRQLTREQCDYLAAIPVLGTVKSFNVSVSAGVVLYEAIRQRATSQR